MTGAKGDVSGHDVLEPSPSTGGKLESLRKMVDERTKVGRAFGKVATWLIVVSILDFTLETVPSLERYGRWFWWSETTIVALFTVEYGIRLAAADRRLRYVFSLEGLIDLAAILPFYLTLGDFRLIRGLRLLRLLRMTKLVRYERAYERLYAALSSIRHELILYLGATGVLVYLAAVGMYYFERDVQPDVFRSIPHTMWWAIVTLTTVGYGDVVPVTAGGRTMTALVLLLSLGIVSVPSALLASALVKDKGRGSPPDPM